ncbi:TPA: LLM class flavin-dependent oxidoreductase [Streptococcus pneumoniae]
MVELGISTFGEITELEGTGQTYSHAERIRQLVAEIELADKVGLDVYGIGEHHRADFAVSAPEIVLAAGAVNTKKIRLTSAVSILSSMDPIRLFQQYATIDALSNGRAEIMAGRGSFTESFPLFGYDLKDYDSLSKQVVDAISKDRPHWQELRYEQYLEQVGSNGAMFVGNPDQVAEKLIRMIEDLGLDRFMLHLPLGSMPHDQVLRAIELFGTQVAPKVRAYFAMKEA